MAESSSDVHRSPRTIAEEKNSSKGGETKGCPKDEYGGAYHDRHFDRGAKPERGSHEPNPIKGGK